MRFAFSAKSVLHTLDLRSMFCASILMAYSIPHPQPDIKNVATGNCCNIRDDANPDRQDAKQAAEIQGNFFPAISPLDVFFPKNYMSFPIIFLKYFRQHISAMVPWILDWPCTSFENKLHHELSQAQAVKRLLLCVLASQDYLSFAK